MIPKENKISRNRLIILILVLIVWIFGISTRFPHNILANLFIAVGVVIWLLIFYRKYVVDAILGFGTFYSICVLATYLIDLFYKGIVLKWNLNIQKDFRALLFCFVPIWCIYGLIYMFREYMVGAAKLMKEYKHSTAFYLIITYSIILLDIVRTSVHTKIVESLFQGAAYFLGFMVFVLVIIYFIKIEEKSKEVAQLNLSLNNKITELRKIKHDYGSQISCLYALYQMGKYEKLGAMLKDIVDRSEATNTAIFVNKKASPMVNSVFAPISSSNIDVIVFDNANYDNISLSEEELFNVISNITRNSVDVLKETKNPIIKYKSYNTHSSLNITISNNGPKIPDEVKNKIFDVGFTTKDNFHGDRGFGLSIVKDILNRCDGRINLISNDDLTQFNIQIPCKWGDSKV